MKASTEFAGRRSPEEVYGRLVGLGKPWRPTVTGSQTDEDAIYALAETDRYGESPANPEIPAGYSFLGQFIAHDVTYDTRLDNPPRHADRPARNRRTPALDLDSIYGRGPVDQPYLYELARPDRFATPRNSLGEIDLPRNDDASVVNPDSGGTTCLRRTALIGDPRNDENVVIAQLHLAFLRFHNARVEELKEAGCEPDRVFEEARRLTRWHYQWVVVHDFLRRLCGSEVLEKLRDRRAMVLEKPPLISHEFALAAFRFGHSMVSSAYHLNHELQHRREDAPLPIFDEFGGSDWNSRDQAAGSNLEGERALPRDWTVQWDRFVDIGNELVQWSRRIDPVLAHPLRHLPLVGRDDRHRSLAYLTLLRGYLEELPSGQSLARHLGLPVVSESESDPLWLYVLKEAEQSQQGRRLGPLGSVIVGETLIGLLHNDETSYVNAQTEWSPTLPARDAQNGFDLSDFLRHAGVPITARDWIAQRSPS